MHRFRVSLREVMKRASKKSHRASETTPNLPIPAMTEVVTKSHSQALAKAVAVLAQVAALVAVEALVALVAVLAALEAAVAVVLAEAVVAEAVAAAQVEPSASCSLR